MVVASNNTPAEYSQPAPQKKQHIAILAGWTGLVASMLLEP